MENSEIFIKIVIASLPTLLLLLGGQFILNLYSLGQKKKEAQIELYKTIKSEQYKSLNELYELFGIFMKLFRKINSEFSDFSDDKIFNEIVKAESRIDSLILKIGSEFVYPQDNIEDIENMLGNLRQSIHIWRESFVKKNKLPFSISSQDDYIRFKSAFAQTSTFMASRIKKDNNYPNIDSSKSDKLLRDIFDRKHEKWKKGHYYTGG